MRFLDELHDLICALLRWLRMTDWSLFRWKERLAKFHEVSASSPLAFLFANVFASKLHSLRYSCGAFCASQVPSVRCVYFQES